MPSVFYSRREFLKLAGLSLIGSWLSACLPESEKLLSTPTSESLQLESTHLVSKIPLPPSATPTFTETIEAVYPTSTPITLPSFTPALISENLSSEILTKFQKERLVSSALKFQADTEKQAIQVARSLGYLVNDGHPASVCGPLSIAILRDAGLLSSYIDLHDFWLLNPRESNAILERTFPKEDFMWFRTDQSISDFDFQAFPLKAGDFIYLFAGDPGSFEHMLTVSRVDSLGRPFSVTNFDTTDGFKIQEVLLYDPTQPGVGKFYDWTNRKYARIGMTGFGGFMLWRFQTPIRDRNELEQQFGQDIDLMIDDSGGVWRIFIKEIGGPVLYARQERKPMHTASAIKVPISMLFFKSLEKIGITDYNEYLSKGIDGRSYQQLLSSMLVDSEEEATTSFEKVILESRLDVMKVLQEWGAPHTYIDIRQSTAMEMASLFEGLYVGRCLDELPRKFILDNLEAYTPGDDLRLGMIRRFLPPGYPFYNKRGTITNEILVVSDTAIINVPTTQGDKVFIVAAFAHKEEKETSYTQLADGLGKIAELLWRYSQAL